MHTKTILNSEVLAFVGAIAVLVLSGRMAKSKKNNTFLINGDINNRNNLLLSAAKHIKEKIKSLLLSSGCMIKKAMKLFVKKMQMEIFKLLIITIIWSKIKLTIFIRIGLMLVISACF